MAETSTPVDALEIELTGPDSDFQKAIEDAIDRMDALDSHVKSVGKSVDAVNQRKPLSSTHGVGGLEAEFDKESHQRYSALLQRHVANKLGELAGVQGLGGETQLVSHLGEAFGAGGAVFGGALILATAIKEATDESFKLVQAQIAYNQELLKSSRHWVEIAKAQLETTKLGKTFRESASTEREEAEKAREENRKSQEAKLHTLGGRLGLIADFASVPITGQSNFDREYQLAQKKIADHTLLADQQEAVARRQDAIQKQRNVEDRAATIESAAIAAMSEGPERRRLELDQHIADDRLKMERENADKLMEMKASHAAAVSTAGLGGAGPDEIRALVQKNIATEEEEKRQGEDRLAGLDAAAGQQRVGEQNRRNEEMSQDQNAFRQAEITATMTGYARDLALLKLANQQKEAEAEKAGGDIKKIRETDNQEVLAKEKDHAYMIETIMIGLNDRLKMAHGGSDSILLEGAKQAREMQHDLLGLGGALTDFKSKLSAVQQAEQDKGILTGIAEANVDLNLALRLTTELQAAQDKLAIENKANNLSEQTGKEAQAKLLLDAKNKNIEWVHDQLAAIHNVRGEAMALQDYVRQVQAALTAGAFGQGAQARADAMDLIARKAAELGISGPYDPGKALTLGAGGGGGRSAVSDVPFMNWDIQRGGVSTTIDPAGHIVTAIKDLERTIERREGLH